MLRRSKALSIVMSLCLCLAMLAPVFVAPATAQAAGVTYTTLTSPTVNTDTVTPQALGKVLVDIPDYRALPAVADSTYEYLTVSLPSGLKFDKTNSDALKVDSQTNCVATAKPISDTTYQITVKQAATPNDDNNASFLLNFAQVVVKSGSGNLDASFAGSNLFPAGTATIAVKGGKGTKASIGSVKVVGDNGEISALTIDEVMPGTLTAKTIIKFKLPAGFTWNDPAAATVTGLWGFNGQDENAEFSLDPDSDSRVMELTMVDGSFTPSTSATTAGRIRIEGLEIAAEDNAKTGDIEMNISSSNNDDVTEEDLVVATYGTYGAEVVEGTQEDVVAGQNNQDIGEFSIKETVAASLLDNRTVYMELPDGVRWAKNPTTEATEGENCFGTATSVNNTDGAKIKYTVSDNASSTDAATIKFKSGEVYVEPGFEGPIEVTVSGNAGVEGTVTIGNCTKAVSLAATNASNVVIGQTNQKAADITITEGAKGAIQEGTTDGVTHDTIILGLDNGVAFTSKPTVTVDEGDLEIDSTKLINDSTALQIKVKYASSKASTIKISDVLLTLDRTVPEGAVTATLEKAVGSNVPGNQDSFSGSTALDEGYTVTVGGTDYIEMSEESAGEVAIAHTITPAEGASAQFKIGSNVYTVNGVAKIMDVAPYIKGSRTYVPVRYLGYALGVAESDVVWDAATSKVTITKGDKVVELTIGSTTITVNGEAQTMDVAPEIANSRTMLPARFVAEGLGATVAWDAATSTVYVQ